MESCENKDQFGIDPVNSSSTAGYLKATVSSYTPLPEETKSSHPPTTPLSSTTTSSTVPTKRPESRSLPVNLPQELLDIVVSDSLILHNGCAHGFDYRYVNVTTVGGKRYHQTPELPTLGRLNRRLWVLTLLASFRGARIELVHDSVAKTVELLRSLPQVIRKSIHALAIGYQEGTPPDYMSFHVLCGILNTMAALKMLKIYVPTYGDYPTHRMIGQGLWQRRRYDHAWRMKHLVVRLRDKWNGVMLRVWGTAPTSLRVLVLLSVTAAGLDDFELRISPVGDGLQLAKFLNIHMLEDAATRRHLIEQVNMQLEAQGRRHIFLWQLLATLWHLFFEEMAIVWFPWLGRLP